MPSRTALLNVSNISEILLPLYCVDIKYFTFVRQYNERERICLTNHGEFHEHYCNSKLYLKDTFDFPINCYSNGYMLWPRLENTKIFHEAVNIFQIHHGITLIDRQNKYCDFYHFGAVNKMVPYDNYVTNLTLLKNFTFLFKEKAQKLINKSEFFTFDEYCVSKEAPISFSMDLEQADTKQPVLSPRQLAIKRYYLGDSFDGVYITKKEFEVLRWMIKGKSTFETSVILSISQRTVQEHIENVKKKLDCYKFSVLISKLARSFLADLLFTD